MTLLTFSGIDGAGKSTQIANLEGYLQRDGVKAPITLWSRGGYTGGFNVLKGLVRRFLPGTIPSPGQSKRRDNALGKSGVRRLWLALSIVDLMRVYGICVRWWRLRGRTVICDRYLWDTLIDFRLNFPTESIELWGLWRILAFVTPRPDVSFLLHISVEESLRRSQAEGPGTFPEPEERRRLRYAQYQQLQDEGRWSVIVDADRPVGQVWEEIHATLPV